MQFYLYSPILIFFKMGKNILRTIGLPHLLGSRKQRINLIDGIKNYLSHPVFFSIVLNSFKLPNYSLEIGKF